jgi:hypothetical protein
MKGSAVVAIGLDRHGVGSHNGARWRPSLYAEGVFFSEVDRQQLLVSLGEHAQIRWGPMRTIGNGGSATRRSPLLIRVAQGDDFALDSPYIGLGAFGEVRASPVALRCRDRRRLAWTHQRAGPGAPPPDHPALRTSDSDLWAVRRTASSDSPSRGIGGCRLR